MCAALARQEPRVRVEMLDLEVEVAMACAENYFTGFSRYIASTGLFVTTPRVRELGTAVEVSFVLPGDETAIAARTEVSWVREHEDPADPPSAMWLQFVDVAPDAVKHIERFIRAREPIARGGI